MAPSNAILLSSSPMRQVATFTLPSSSPLPSPSQAFKRRPSSICVGSSAISIPSTAATSFTTASTSFTTASALLKQSQIEEPMRLGVSSVDDKSGKVVAEGSYELEAGATKAVVPKAVKRCKPDKIVENGATEEKAPRKRQVKNVDLTMDSTPQPPKRVRKALAKKRKSIDLVDDQKQGLKEPDKSMKEFLKTDATEPTNNGPAGKAKKPRVKRIAVTNDIITGVSTEEQEEGMKPKILNVVGEKSAKVKQLRKPRAKKPIHPTQSLIPKDNITKSLPEEKSFAPKSFEEQKQVDGIDIGIVQAVRRKVDWTPPVPVMNPTLVSPAPALVYDTEMSLDGRSSKGFDDLFGNFGFINNRSVKKDKAPKNTSKATEQAVVRKRKLIELVRTTSSDATTSPTKKTAKKKPLTITERATAAYAEVETDAAPLLQYFSQPAEDFNKGAKRRPRSPVKGSKQAPILLSPESALKQVAKQDYVFGTSSQLAREESPTLLRDIHEAIKASLDLPDSFAEVSNDQQLPTKSGKLWTAAARDGEGCLLKHVHAEIDSSDKSVPASIDGFVDIDSLVKDANDDSRLSEAAEPLHTTEPPTQNINSEPRLPTFGCDEYLVKFPNNEKDNNPPPSAQSPNEISTLNPSTDAEAENVIRPTANPLKKQTRTKASSVRPKSTKPTTKPSARSKKAVGVGLMMPKFETYSTSQLAKEIASYHFKAVKNRDAMITLLETCWRAKHQAALQSTDVNSSINSSDKAALSSKAAQASPVKKARGRPKKDAAASPTTNAKPGRPRKADSLHETAASPKKTKPKKAPILKDSQEEIDDSEAQLTPSPPPRHHAEIGKPPLPLDLSVEGLEASPEPTSSQQQAELFTHITKAVVTAPRATEPENPSWHEKILMYDPIILEDLTVWLNTGNLGRVGWDGEVAPAEVKKWCESKSICCLWKENLGGGNRSRY